MGQHSFPHFQWQCLDLMATLLCWTWVRIEVCAHFQRKRRALVGRTAAILDVAMLCAVEGAQCKTRELP